MQVNKPHKLVVFVCVCVRVCVCVCGVVLTCLTPAQVTFFGMTLEDQPIPHHIVNANAHGGPLRNVSYERCREQIMPYARLCKLPNP
jgi:hypothetical protein